MNSFNGKRYACFLCDWRFSRKYDLERHKLRVHPDVEEEEEGDSDDGEESESKEEVSGGESSDDELEDNETYREWYATAKEVTEDMRQGKYQKYLEDGMNPDMAKEKAYLKTVWAIKREFFDEFRSFLRNYAHLKDDDVYSEITDDLEAKIDKGVNVDKAVKRTLAKYRSKFDGLFQYDDEEEEEEEEQEMEEGEREQVENE